MKKTIKEYMQESPLFEGIIEAEENDGSELIMEDLAKELDDKKFAKFAKMPTDVPSLRAACAKHKGFADLKSRAAAVGMKITSGFIRYCRYVDKKGKTVKNVLEDVVLNFDCPGGSTSVTDWQIYFRHDFYGDRTSTKNANKLELNARIHPNMTTKELIKAKEEVDALVDFVVWFNSQRIGHILPVFTEEKPL